MADWRRHATIYDSGRLSAALEADSSPVLYTHVLCPYAHRAWLALLEKGVQCRVVNIDLSAKPSWYLRLNPAGLVPAVAHRSHVQTESLDICRWVDDRFDGPELNPAAQRAQVDGLIWNCSNFASAGLSVLAGSSGRSWGIGSSPSERQVQRFKQQLQQLAESITSSGGPFLTGASPSLADIAYYPFAERFEIAMPEFSGFRPSEGGGRQIGAWLEAMAARDSVKTSSADSKLLLQAFRQHRSLDFFDFDKYEAAALHPHLRAQVAS